MAALMILVGSMSSVMTFYLALRAIYLMFVTTTSPSAGTIWLLLLTHWPVFVAKYLLT